MRDLNRRFSGLHVIWRLWSRPDLTCVGWYKKTGQWQAKIRVAGKQEHLGYFDDEAEAARAFDTRAAELGRPTNF
jgi:hypothetical protein